MQEGGREEWSDWSGDVRDREGDKNKKSEGHESPKDIEVVEEIEWPCGVCGLNVSDDGLECVGCEKWYHGDCSEVLNPIEYRVKQYKCLKCTEKRVSKSSKTKDGAIIKRPGRPPKSRERSVSPK